MATEKPTGRLSADRGRVPTAPGFYPYRKPNGRLAVAFVTRAPSGKLYATLLKHRGWKQPACYSVGAMGGTWYARMRVTKK